MSYYKVKNISFSKDFRKVKMEAASNNIRPLWYINREFKAEEDETTFDFVKSFVNNFLAGVLKINDKKHYINYVINYYLENKGINATWLYELDFGAVYKKDENGKRARDENGNFIIEFVNDEDYKKWMEYKDWVEKVKANITNAILNNNLKKQYNNLKKEKHYLVYMRSYPEFVKKNSSKGFYRTSNIDYAKQFNGLDAVMMQDSYILIQYGFEFVKVDEFNDWYNKKALEYKKLLDELLK